ncbi:hypothetical protein AB0A63_31365 [Lentzea sp. NPDC042327]
MSTRTLTLRGRIGVICVAALYFAVAVIDWVHRARTPRTRTSTRTEPIR